jgi:hypothetical protein
LGGFYAGDLDDACTGGLDFFNEFGSAEFVFCEGFDVGYGFAADALASHLA